MQRKSSPSLVQREMWVVIYPSQALTARLQTSKHAVQFQHIWRTSSSRMTPAACRLFPYSIKCRWTVLDEEWQAICPGRHPYVSLLCQWLISWNDLSRNDTGKAMKGHLSIANPLLRNTKRSLWNFCTPFKFHGVSKTNMCVTNVRTTKREDNALLTQNWNNTAYVSTQLNCWTHSCSLPPIWCPLLQILKFLWAIVHTWDLGLKESKPKTDAGLEKKWPDALGRLEEAREKPVDKPGPFGSGANSVNFPLDQAQPDSPVGGRETPLWSIWNAGDVILSHVICFGHASRSLFCRCKLTEMAAQHQITEFQAPDPVAIHSKESTAPIAISLGC